jgi:heterodisulfide reductase subunit C2
MRVNAELAAEAKRHLGIDAQACMHCGICTAVCPMGYEVLPRRLFRYALLGLEGRLKELQPQIFSCLLCRMCEANCPAGVHIAKNVRLLRTLLNREEPGLEREST